MKKKNFLTNIILIFVLLAGLSLLLYPSFSDWWNSFHQSVAITNYAERVADLNEEEYALMWDAAVAFNQQLLLRENPYYISKEEHAVYEQCLNADGNGIMGYIEVPKINCTLPIYHGTSDAVLQVAVGHLDWTSLPTGGESTHCVLTAHRGLPSAKLFSDLDEMVVGDTFVLRILNETLTYEVDQILIVEPDQSESLLVTEGMDYCTLVTCTPYGVNSHRMLVRGHRIENAPEKVVIHVSEDAIPIEPRIVAPFLAIPLLLILLLLLPIYDSRQKKRNGGKKSED